MATFHEFVEAFHRHFTRDANRRAQLGIDTNLGDLPDATLAGQAERIEEARSILQLAGNMETQALTDDQRLDIELATLQLQAEVHRGTYEFNSRTEFQQHPDAGAQIGDGIFTIFLVDPRPATQRIDDITSRIEGIPGFLRDTLARLDTPVARWVKMDLECVEELPSFFATIQDWAQREAWPDLPRLALACEQATAALSDYARELAKLPTADNFHIGDAHARDVVRLSGIDLTLEQLHALARDYLSEVGATIEASRQQLVRKHGLDANMSAAELHEWLNRKYRVNVDISGNDFTPILNRYHEEREKILEFIRERDLFPVLDDQDMQIVQTPDFMVPLIPAGAMTGPAAFREGTRISQIFLTLTADRIDDHTELGIPMMMVHEGIPGHHLHLATGRVHDSVIRRHAYASDQAEGWTTMLEDYMLDQGYLGDLKEEALFSGKRDISRIGARVAIDLFFMTGDRKYLDVGVDCDTSSDDPFRAAAELLKAVTGFSEARAQAELNWYSTERGIPLTYLTGNKLVWDLKGDVTQHCQTRSQPLSGIELDREFHRAFLRAGLMPVRFMREVFRREDLLA